MSYFSSADTLNIPLARKVLEHLIANPDEHEQNYYGVQSPCGTTGCIAGWTVILDEGFSSSPFKFDEDGEMPASARVYRSEGMAPDVIRIDAHAGELLGLDSADAKTLFHTYDNADALAMLSGFISAAEAVQS